MTRRRTARDTRVRGTSVVDTVRMGSALLVPWPGRSLTRSRSRLAALLARLGMDRRVVHLLEHLRHRYGPGPLRLAVPGRRMVLLLSRRDVRHVLEDTSGRFVPMTPRGGGRRTALDHLQPHGVILPAEEDHAGRRRSDEIALDTHQKVHKLAGPFMMHVQREATDLLAAVSANHGLSWDEYAASHWRLVRRIVLGYPARGDRMLTDLLSVLGGGSPRSSRRAASDTFARRLRMYLDRADPDSLAGLLADAPRAPGVDPVSQVTRWLAALGSTGILAYRTLALLAAHPDRLARVRAELTGLPGAAPPSPVSVPCLRACVLESARLWPVTPVILRESTIETRWDGRAVPAGTAFVIVTPFFNRDRRTLPHADRFSPEAWLNGRAADGAVMPFGAGAGRCPGESLALLISTALLATLLREHNPRQLRPGTRLDPRRPLPYALDHFTLRFAFDRVPPP